MKRALLILLVCAAPAAAADTSQKEGALIFQEYCIQCHGINAGGDGPMAELIAIDTPDLTVLARDNGGSFPRADVAAQIDGRTPMLAHGGDMPIFGDALEDSQIVFMKLPEDKRMRVSGSLAALIRYLESIQK